MNIIGIIPSRYASTRFPGKPLVMIKGKTMIQRVYEQASKAGTLAEVIVATDDQRIYKHVEDSGGKVIMTRPDHQSGTERCNEVIAILEKQGKQFDAVVNIQGDEPVIDPEQIDKVALCFRNEDTEIATLAKQITDNEELTNPNIVKLVVDKNSNALYFSRSIIPYLRNSDRGNLVDKHQFLRHIGVYGYKTGILKQIARLPQSSLEKAESLEQLRWIENDYTIRVEQTETSNIDINTPEDLSKLINKI